MLNKNYRCREEIVRASSLLIEDNRERFAKNLQAEKQGGEKVKLHLFSSKGEEEDYIVEELKKIKPENLEKTAVISRTNAQAAGLSKVLFRHGIPFHIQGKTGCLKEHPVSKDLSAYLRFAKQTASHLAAGKAGTREDFLRIMNKPCRYIHREALSSHIVSESDLLEYYRDRPYMQKKIQKLFVDLKRISTLRPYLAVDYIRKNIGYDSFLSEKKKVPRPGWKLRTAYRKAIVILHLWMNGSLPKMRTKLQIPHSKGIRKTRAKKETVSI